MAGLGLRADAGKNFVDLTFFVNSSSSDEDKRIASGLGNPGLSDLGKKQAVALNGIVKNRDFEVVYCSDLRRAVETADIAFDVVAPIVTDIRLRECNFGDLNGAKSDRIEQLILAHIERPFPNGESLRDVEKRTRSFLEQIGKKHVGQRIAIMSHQGPQLALEVILKGTSWERAIMDDWRTKSPPQWRPGWDYRLLL
jgi:broad specificity phosphatase PhoE